MFAQSGTFQQTDGRQGKYKKQQNTIGYEGTPEQGEQVGDRQPSQQAADDAGHDHDKRRIQAQRETANDDGDAEQGPVVHVRFARPASGATRTPAASSASAT